MNVLLIGGGGREHALAFSISSSKRVGRLFCSPGNAGIAKIAHCVNIDTGNHEAVVDFCKISDISFVVIGPEVELVAGLSDTLSAHGIKCFGPSQAAAQLEGSKTFMKEICTGAGIPTAAYEHFSEQAAALSYVDQHSAPLVIKADGLAAGKGVIIAQTHEEARAAVRDCFSGRFGEAGRELIIEEFLEGEEASFFVLTDGQTILPLTSAQDHKRVFDGDKGPNTGGMGAYSPAPVMTSAMTERVMSEIIEPTIKAMTKRGTPYKGVLYAGLMIGEEGPKLIEYNVRFGDPECQVLVMRLRSDLVPAMLACVDGTLERVSLMWREDVSLTVVMAAKGYPGTPAKGGVIRGLIEAGDDPQVEIFHAGTKKEGDRIIANGGRVLNVTARGKTVGEARERAYKAIDKINWSDGFYRTDIGWRAIKREGKA